MKRLLACFIIGGCIIAGAAYVGRGFLRETWENAQRPTLPEPIVYHVSTTTAQAPEPAKPSAPTTTMKVVKPQIPKPSFVARATSTDPLAWSGDLPASINLAVPFFLQAPKQNWAMPYQEACEEGTAIMVDEYYRGRTAPYTPDEADKMILDTIKFEEEHYGGKPDMSAAEDAVFIREYFGYKTVLVRKVTDARDIKAALANGYPVIVPASGKSLGNPNYHNGGPIYHMLVIKGYLADGRWITNDSGTRKGADYIYGKDVIMNALHDWNNGDVLKGEPLMIVVIPNTGQLK